MHLPWGVLQIETRGDDLLLAVGATADEAASGMRLSSEAIIAEADAYAARCDMMPEADPVLRTMVIQGMHAALSSIRQDEDGKFGGLAAGQGYSSPARTYYRDGYWTLQPLLKLAPECGARADPATGQGRAAGRRGAERRDPLGQGAVGGVAQIHPASGPLQGTSSAAGGLVERPFRQPAVLRAGRRRLCPRDRRRGRGDNGTGPLSRRSWNAISGWRGPMACR